MYIIIQKILKNEKKHTNITKYNFTLQKGFV